MRRWRVIAGLVALVFVAVAAVLLWPRAGSGQEVARRLDQGIRAEIPAVATRAQAEAWLDARGLQHDYLAGPPSGWLGSQKWAEVAGLRDEDVGGAVWVAIECPNPTVGVEDYGRLSIYFFLDRQGVCIGHVVHFFKYSL